MLAVRIPSPKRRVLVGLRRQKRRDGGSESPTDAIKTKDETHPEVIEIPMTGDLFGLVGYLFAMLGKTEREKS